MRVKGTATQVHLPDFSWLNLPFVFSFLSKPALSHPSLYAKAASAGTGLASQRLGQARAQGPEPRLGKAVGMGMLREERMGFFATQTFWPVACCCLRKLEIGTGVTH